MKKYCINLLLLLTTVVTYSQNKTYRDKYTRVYNEITDNIINGEYINSKIRIDSLYNSCVTKKDTLGIYSTKQLTFLLNTRQDNYSLPIQIIMQDRKIIHKMKESSLKDSLLADNYASLGDIEQKKGELINASKNFIVSLKYSEKIKDSFNISYNSKGLATIFTKLKLFNDSKKYLNISLKYDSSSLNKCFVYKLHGNNSYSQDNFFEAKKYFEKSLSFVPNNDFLLLKDAYNSLGLVNISLGKNKEGYNFLLKAHNLIKQINAPKKEIAISLLNLSVACVSIKDYVNAKKYMDECELLIKELNLLLLEKEIYSNFYENYKKMSDYKNALKYVEIYNKYNDSLASQENFKTIEALKVKYETDIKDSKIKNQETNIKVLNKNRNTIIIILFILFMLLLLTIFLYSSKIKSQKSLLKKQEELSLEKINTIIESQKNEMYKSHLEGQNKERERIAKDLHDNISGNLAAIKLKMSQLKNQTSEMQQILTNLDNTYDEVRSISHDLLPKKMFLNNFSQRIEQLVDFNNTNALKLSLEIFPIEDINSLKDAIQLEIYSIIQETLTNIHKHSRATKGFINITLHNDYVNVLVEDNGIGFSKENIKEGIGIKNIKSRIKLLNGDFKIDSNKDSGTVININIPI